MKRIFHYAAMIFVTVLVASVAFASNYSFLNTTAFHFFRGDDANLMAANIDKALNTGRDNQKLSWHNPATGSWGYAIPSHSNLQKGARCRHLKIFNSAKSVTGLTNYNFCKINNEWKFVSQYH